MTLDYTQLKNILPSNIEIEKWLPLLNQYLPEWDINTKDRLVMFFAQCSHESNQFIRLKENLNYSKEGLLKTFPKYFNDVLAEQYARKPIMIANRVYANRMGNGTEQSGDGWLYRGRGIIMTTGKNNYQEFATYIQKPLSETVTYLETKEGAVHYACFYWKTRNLNTPSDNKDITLATKLINGGKIGLFHRTSEYERISKII